MTTEKILCPRCKQHEAVIMTRKAKTMIKGKEVEYDETVYFCTTIVAEDEYCYFVPARVMNENLANARNAYRQKYGLSTT